MNDDRRPEGVGPDGGFSLTPSDDAVLLDAILGFRSAMVATGGPGAPGPSELEDLADFLR